MDTARRRCLVVRGGWRGHHPEATTDLFLPFLEEAGFDVRIEPDPAVYADAETMRATDLVVQAVSMSAIGDDALAGLVAAVRAGTGLVGWHGGIVASFSSSADYLQLVGGVFVHHAHRRPPEQRTGGGAEVFQRHTIRITAAGRAHPVTAGVADFDLDTEQYWVLTDAYDEVLAETTQAARPFDAWHRPVTCPAVWVRHWGAGRVVVATPGHDPAVVAHPSVTRILRQGMAWAARA